MSDEDDDDDEFNLDERNVSSCCDLRGVTTLRLDLLLSFILKTRFPQASLFSDEDGEDDEAVITAVDLNLMTQQNKNRQLRDRQRDS